jgi:hypothetical protein
MMYEALGLSEVAELFEYERPILMECLVEEEEFNGRKFDSQVSELF